MDNDEDLNALARRVIDRARDQGLTIATAESCTGGLIAGALTDIAGSSDVVDCGFVTYSNAAKTRMLGIPAPLIAAHGAVSEAVARAMCDGALQSSGAALAVAVTGIAGPGGGSADKPVGLVHLAVCRQGHSIRHLERRYGDLGRDRVRRATVIDALQLLFDQMG